MSKPLLDEGSPSLAPHGDILKVPGDGASAKRGTSKASETNAPTSDQALPYPENPDLPATDSDK